MCYFVIILLFFKVPVSPEQTFKFLKAGDMLRRPRQHLQHRDLREQILRTCSCYQSPRQHVTEAETRLEAGPQTKHFLQGRPFLAWYRAHKERFQSTERA